MCVATYYEEEIGACYRVVMPKYQEWECLNCSDWFVVSTDTVPDDIKCPAVLSVKLLRP